jgi:hypothetical protein
MIRTPAGTRSHQSYEFLTQWQVRAPVHNVWDIIFHSERWPEWWRGLMQVVELERGDEDGVGNLRRYTWQGMLPYRITFDIRTTRISEPELLQGAASGDLEGTGTWRIHDEDGITSIRCHWEVSTTKRWMNLVAPLARPLFRWNHDRIMAWGETGLIRRLTQERHVHGALRD